MPISYRRLKVLRGRDRARWDEQLAVWVVDTPYDPDLGLRLDLPDR